MDTSPTSLLRSYTPRVAIVTGSAQGIGYDIAHRLADDGIDIVINDIPAKAAQANEVAAEIQKKGRRAIAVLADVASEPEVISLIEKAVQGLGSVDIMVANAGIAKARGFLETSVEDFNTVLAVNARGVFLCYKHAAIQMIKQGRGGRLIAIELRKYGITANAYAPGVIRTPLTRGPGNDNASDYEQVKMKEILGLPLDTPVANADVVASIVSYLVRPESYFINGQSISVDGGLRYS
ncbi:hypothetical protein EW145_g7536 [Phellinidium pouzarii]|uniref:3-oxoacyl-[acyl-carrier-protein] reductase n=1 Tax=Phellinidium pouzarii TaxID=167371 RepID=A0A4S4KHQ7_9AGAM|nr:hypothetical protein EW145_g7536 [Phellinidium pouzarii]